MAPVCPAHSSVSSLEVHLVMVWCLGFFLFFYNLFLFYVHWYFDYMYVCMRVLDPLELELHTVVSCRVGVGN